MRVMIRTLLVLIAMPLFACDGLTDETIDAGKSGDCSLRDCSSGFAFEFNDPTALADGVYTVEVAGTEFAERSELTGTLSCEVVAEGGSITAGHGCLSFMFSHFAPTLATLTVTRASEVLLETTVTTIYTEFRPNGPCCAPLCHEAPPYLIELN